MLLRILISVLLVAASLPGGFGYEILTNGEGLLSGGGETAITNSTEDVDFSDISPGDGPDDLSEINSDKIIANIIATYAEECRDELGWDIFSIVNSFMS